MATIQFATRVDEQQAETFRSLAHQLGSTPSDILRMFVSAFNACGGFPYEVRVPKPEPFASEDEAMRFVADNADGMLDEAW